VVTRPALRYFGGKFRLAPWIINQFPEHMCYVEPFGGAMGVLLRKAPSLFEVYNDLDGEVVNFFRQLREHADELIRVIELTPYARAEQILSFDEPEGLSDLERARRLYVRCWQSHGGGRTQWRTGWRYQVNNNRGRTTLADWNQTDHLSEIVKRLKGVQIDQDDAIRVIQRFDRETTLFYIDPPYLMGTRSLRWGKKAYTCELDDAYHVRLGEVLQNIKGMAIVSGKPSAMYDGLFEGWTKLQKTVPTDFQSKTIEVLWISPKVAGRRGQRLFMEEES
jgi:DNA adenine methylase